MTWRYPLVDIGAVALVGYISLDGSEPNAPHGGLAVLMIGLGVAQGIKALLDQIDRFFVWFWTPYRFMGGPPKSSVLPPLPAMRIAPVVDLRAQLDIVLAELQIELQRGHRSLPASGHVPALPHSIPRAAPDTNRGQTLLP